MLPLSMVEAELIRQGYFSLFDWLLSQDLLAYADYEAWRYRRIPTLDGRFQPDDGELDRLIRTAEAHAASLGLSTRAVDYSSWDAGGGLLRLSACGERQRGLTQRWQRPRDIPQMDLFLDNSVMIAANALLEALAGRRWESAGEALRRLTRLDPGNRRLGGYNDLLNYGRHMQANPRLEADAVGPELRALEGEVTPLAREHLGSSARDYLACAWRRLADNLQGVPFDPAQPRLHLSYALARIPDWRALEAALTADPQLPDQPPLLERLAGCLAAAAKQVESSALWAVLFDRYPAHAEEAIERSRQQPIYRLWDAFWESGNDWRPEEFTGFLLIGQPGLLAQLRRFTPLHEEPNRAVAELLHCQRARLDEVMARRRLQQVSPGLLK